MQISTETIWEEVAIAWLMVTTIHPHTRNDVFSRGSMSAEVVGAAQTCRRTPLHS